MEIKEDTDFKYNEKWSGTLNNRRYMELKFIKLNTKINEMEVDLKRINNKLTDIIKLLETKGD